MKIPHPFELVAEALECDIKEVDEGSEVGVTQGWDSFAYLKILMAMENHYNIELNEQSVTKFRRMRAILDHYRTLGNGV